jgi:hypothetical protein
VPGTLRDSMVTPNSRHVCARAGFPARKDHPRGEYSSHQQAAWEGAA